MPEVIAQTPLVKDKRNHSRWPLKIKTFGGLTLLKEGVPLQFKCKAQQKPIELLKTLIAYSGLNVCEEKLSEVLWPDAEGDAAHRNYNTTLHRLRKLIGTNTITVNRGQASLDCRFCWLDIWAYQDLCDRLESMSKNEKFNIEQIHCATEELLLLYQGPFLKNETETPALLIQREQQRSRLRRALKIVVVRYNQADHCEYALRLYQKALEIDELSEELYRGVIACYAALGLYSEALAAYENCRRVLDAIFGITPNDQTTALYRAIRTNGNKKLAKEDIKKHLFSAEK